MTIEQPDLFADFFPENKEQISASAKTDGADNGWEKFLPGVNKNEAYNDIHDLGELREIAKDCQDCRLRATCKQVVFGCGDINSKVMVIGEGPGADEDQQGIPFVGKAGQLLNKILMAAELERDQLYITNVVKCRPPENRLPSPDEVKCCSKYLEAQIRIMKPRIIVCLGSLASQTVVDPKVRISKIRGQWIERNQIRIMATFHPAALLRNPAYKRPTWSDFQAIRDYYKTIKQKA